jgi:hypothetical protein
MHVFVIVKTCEFKKILKKTMKILKHKQAMSQ